MTGRLYLGTHDFSGATVIGVGDPSPFECTVGATGADYETLGAAIADSKTRILVIDDTTETGDITLPSNCVIHGLGMHKVNVNMGSYKFDDSTNADFEFKHLKFTRNGSGKLMDSFSGLILDYVYFDINSITNFTAPVYIESPSKPCFITNCVVDSAGGRQSGFYFRGANSAGGIFVSNIKIIGRNSSCYDMLITEYMVNITGIEIEGTFSTTSKILDFSRGGTISNISIYSTTNPITIQLQNGVTLLNVNVNSSSNYVQFNFVNGGSILSNVHTDSSSSSNILVSSTSSSVISNIIGDGSLTIDSSAKFTIVNNCDFESGISITGNDTTITGCKIGSDAGGGSNTIAINSGANRTIINGCRTDAAISDSGTDTVGIGNVVY